jgi:hypothetical protein
MDKTAPHQQVTAPAGAGVSVRKRSAPFQKPMRKRGTITQAQADAAVRRYFSRTQAK